MNTNTLRRFYKRFSRLVLALNCIGMLACLLSVLLVSLDVVLRKLTDSRLSVRGSGEISAYCLVLMCMFSIPALQVRNGHIRVSVLSDRLTGKLLLALRRCVLAIECAAYVLLSWGSIRKVQMFLETGTRMDVLNIPKWPFALACVICFSEMAVLLGVYIVILPEMEKSNGEEDEEE